MESSGNRPARAFVLHEASYRQMLTLRPNVAVLPWGATEGHNYHLPHGTDVIEATALGERAVADANQRGARCVLLPTVPFGIDHSQTTQVATITMRASTQQAVLRDVAESLVRQGIDRLVVLNFHGGNDFRSMIRDVMFSLPIFIVQIEGYLTVDCSDLLQESAGDHANEFETSLMLHLTPGWVDMSVADEGKMTASKLPALSSTPGVWCPRDWSSYAPSTGAGDPRHATADCGRKILDRLVGGLTPVLVELSKAQEGDFPYVIRSSLRGLGQ